MNYSVFRQIPAFFASLVTALVVSQGPLLSSAWGQQCRPDSDGYNCADPSRQAQMRAEAQSRGERDGRQDGRNRGYEEGRHRGTREGEDRGEREGREREYQNGLREGEDSGYRDGRNDGLREGEYQGRRDGETKGRQDGLQAGYNAGYNRGDDEGYRDGYREGQNSGSRDQGYKDGYEVGKARGLSEGEKNGYREGYAKAVADLESKTDGENTVLKDGQFPSKIELPDLIQEMEQALFLMGMGEFSAMASRQKDDLIRIASYSNPYSHSDLRSAYDRGYERGNRDGHDDGYRDAYREYYDRAYRDAYNRSYPDERRRGYDIGYRQGKSRGYNAGYREGYDGIYRSAYQRAYDQAYPERQDEGYRDGYPVGKARGYQQGKQDAYNEGYANGDRAGYRDFYQKTYDQFFPKGVAAAQEHYRTHAVLKVVSVELFDDLPEKSDGIYQRGETFGLKMVINNYGRVDSGSDAIARLTLHQGQAELGTQQISLQGLVQRKTNTVIFKNIGGVKVDAALNGSFKITALLSNQDQGQLSQSAFEKSILYPLEILKVANDHLVSGQEAAFKVLVKNRSQKPTRGAVKGQLVSKNQLAEIQTPVMDVGVVAPGQQVEIAWNLMVDTSTPLFERFDFQFKIVDQERKLGDGDKLAYSVRPYKFDPTSDVLLFSSDLEKLDFMKLSNLLSQTGLKYDVWDLTTEGVLTTGALANYKNRGLLLWISDNPEKTLSAGTVSAIKSYLQMGGGLVVMGNNLAQAKNMYPELFGDWLDMKAVSIQSAPAQLGVFAMLGKGEIRFDTAKAPSAQFIEIGRLAKSLTAPAVPLTVEDGLTDEGTKTYAYTVASFPFEESKRSYRAVVLGMNPLDLMEGDAVSVLSRSISYANDLTGKIESFKQAVGAGNNSVKDLYIESITALMRDELMAERRAKSFLGRSMYYMEEYTRNSAFKVWSEWAASQQGELRQQAVQSWPKVEAVVEEIWDRSGSSRYYKVVDLIRPLKNAR